MTGKSLIAAAGLFFLPALIQAGEFDLYNAQVGPLLLQHCLKCHGPEKQKGGLRLDQRADALRGGDDGVVIVPGKSSESLLLKLVSGLDPEKVMPPKGERLNAEQINFLKTWIDQGAHWPDPSPLNSERSTNLHWAFEPPRLPVPPAVQNRRWV